MRVLKGYSKEERKELEAAEDNGFLSAITLFRGISNGDCHCHELSKKYCREDINDENQMAKDIVDFYTGKAKFTEQKYYIKMPKVDYQYLVQKNDGTFDWCEYLNTIYRKYFTEQEIKDIDPRYMAFAVPVEESK